MEKYKNEEYLKERIMGQSRHLFIYGYNNQERSKFLKNLENDYPFTAELSEPIALYFDSFGLPKIDNELKNKDIYILHTISREYLSFSIASKILEKTIEFNKNNLNDKLSCLINLINRNKNKNRDEIVFAADLLKEFKISRNFYYESYINYTNGLIESIPIEDIAIPFLDLNTFVNRYKRCLDMQSYFGLIFDKKHQLSMLSVQAINNFIGARINSDISIKVATEPDDWETYHDANGQYIELIHDYGIVELDNSYKAYTKKLTR